MALHSYADLQRSVMQWLARPDDPLLVPNLPDLVVIFEREARRRLKCGDAEQRAYMTVDPHCAPAVTLPVDCRQLRLVTANGRPLDYVEPHQLTGNIGNPHQYTLHGRELRLGAAPSGSCQLEILYQAGVPPLSNANPSNWLLVEHPDCYLFGVLAETTLFIGDTERVPVWLKRRDDAFQSIEDADRKLRWSGSPLTIKPDVYGQPIMGAWAIAPPCTGTEPDIGGHTDVVGSTPLPQGTTGYINVRNSSGAPIDITLPPYPLTGDSLTIKDVLGNAGQYNIIIIGAIDGSASYTLVSDYASIGLYFSGSQWSTR